MVFNRLSTFLTCGMRGTGRFSMSFSWIANPIERARLTIAPSREAIVSWNTYAAEGKLSVRLVRSDEPLTPWMPLAQWAVGARRSFSADLGGMRIATDVISADMDFDGVDLYGPGVDFTFASVTTPQGNEPSLPSIAPACILDVPLRSQYVTEAERGWCSAATTAMLCAFFAVDGDVETVARAVFDDAYGGTGNWTFNVAYAGSLGLRATVAYLKNLDQAARLIDLGIPLGISYGWESGELSGAPLERSDGHLAVLCGFAHNGDCVVNDPASPNIRVVYPRIQLERLWLRNRGVAYVVAPNGVPFEKILERA